MGFIYDGKKIEVVYQSQAIINNAMADGASKSILKKIPIHFSERLHQRI